MEQKSKISADEHLGLVHSCAKRFIGKGIEYDDLYQAGCVGLCKAINGFDEERGLQFSTYAVTVILGEIRHLFREGGAVKVSRSLKELNLKANRVREKYLKERGVEPSVSELANILKVDTDELCEAISSGRAVYSIDRESEEDGIPKIELAQPDGEESLLDRISVQNAMEHLDDGEKKLITLRYFKDKTQSATAKELGISQVQVSRKEKVILYKLRQILSA